MNVRPRLLVLVLTFLTSLPATGAALAAGGTAKLPDKIEFNRDIRPILSDNCYACHGPDKNKRKADLRLDTKQGLLGKAGHTGVVVPSKPDESELWRRVCSKDDDRMPPAQFAKVLSESDRKLLRRWIEQGAKWEGHWAFLPIARPEAAGLKTRLARPKNDIDRFILKALDEHGLAPSPEADRDHALPAIAFRFDRIAAVDRPRWTRSSPTRARRRMRKSSTGCWARRSSASGWPCGGSTWCGMPTASAITATSR